MFQKETHVFCLNHFLIKHVLRVLYFIARPRLDLDDRPWSKQLIHQCKILITYIVFIGPEPETSTSNQCQMS